MEASLSAQQMDRLSEPVAFIFCLPPPKLPPNSSIFIPEEELILYIAIGDSKQLQIRASSEQTVGQLAKKISGELQGKQEPCMVFGDEVMHYNDKLADWGVHNHSIIRVRQRKLHPIVITVKFIEIKAGIFQYTADQTIKVGNIRNQIYIHLQIDPQHFQLYMEGEELREDDLSLADLGIYGDYTFLLKICTPKGIKDDHSILLMDYSAMQIGEVRSLDQILCFDAATKEKTHKKVQLIEKYQVRELSKVRLANDKEVICSEGTYFYTDKQRWVPCSQIDGLKLNDKIMVASGEFVEVENIHFNNRISFLAGTNLTHLLLANYMPFFVNGVLISPALTLHVLLRKKDSLSLTSYDMHPEMSILDLKKRISKKLDIPVEEQRLFVESRQLILKDSCSIKSIYTPNLIIQVSLTENELKQAIKVQKMVVMTFEDITQRVSYNTVAGKTCHEVITQYFPIKVNDYPCYGILFEQQLINLDTKIQDIVPIESEAFYYETFTLIIIKFPERFKLSHILKKYTPPQANQTFFSKMMSYIPFVSSQPPVLKKFKQNYKYHEVKAVLANFYKEQLTDNRKPIYQYIAQLIKFIKQQPKHFQKCYRALPGVQFPTKFVQNSVINAQEFLCCSPHRQLMRGLLGRGGVLLQIQSISGRKVEVPNREFEIVFLPFTYFIISKITRTENLTEVELLEMPTALTFQRPLILWVDDAPKGNQEQIRKYRKKGTEIVQLSSTAMARRWFEQFGWVVNRLGIKMRVVTDMVREEGQKKPNYEAGIDLIEYLFNERGFTTPVLVFCSDCLKGRENIANRRIRQDRFHRITNKFDDLQKYLAFESCAQSRPMP